MSDNPRNTQFAGFADLVYEETGKALSHADMKLRIARLAYDLVEHTVGYSLEYLHECGIELSGSMNSRIIPSIPDMDELPKEEEECDNGEIRKALEELIHSDKWADTFNERGITSIHTPATRPIEPVREGFFRMNVRDFGPYGPRTIDITPPDDKTYHGTVHYKEDEENVHIEGDVYLTDKGEAE